MRDISCEPKFYRQWVKSQDLVATRIAVGETDLFICARRNLEKEATSAVYKYRKQIQDYIARDKDFLISLEPVDVPFAVPAIIRDMAMAAKVAGTGPMAAVAGAVAEYVGRDLLEYSDELIVENGGDIFLATARPRLIGIYAGNSPFTGKLALEVLPQDCPLGICTSSGTVGHSLSFGQADAATVVAKSCPLADCLATSVGNRINAARDIEGAVKYAGSVPGIIGALAIVGDSLGLWGKIKLVQ
jgi:hypothetical protein